MQDTGCCGESLELGVGQALFSMSVYLLFVLVWWKHSQQSMRENCKGKKDSARK